MEAGYESTQCVSRVLDAKKIQEWCMQESLDALKNIYAKQQCGAGRKALTELLWQIVSMYVGYKGEMQAILVLYTSIL